MTLKIDETTRDLCFDSDGCMVCLEDNETIIQNLRDVLLTWKNEFFADVEHGVDYTSVLGCAENDFDMEQVREIIRDAVYQEPSILKIERIEISYQGRSLEIYVLAKTKNSKNIEIKVDVI